LLAADADRSATGSLGGLLTLVTEHGHVFLLNFRSGFCFGCLPYPLKT
jgi:hypothetical protein